jgi:hypothetical protein
MHSHIWLEFSGCLKSFYIYFRGPFLLVMNNDIQVFVAKLKAILFFDKIDQILQSFSWFLYVLIFKELTGSNNLWSYHRNSTANQDIKFHTLRMKQIFYHNINYEEKDGRLLFYLSFSDNQSGICDNACLIYGSLYTGRTNIIYTRKWV